MDLNVVRTLYDTPDVMWGIAHRLQADREKVGLAGASYPALNYVPESPWAMVRQSLRIPSIYAKDRYKLQVVSAFIEVVLLVEASETSHRDAARLDPMISPVLDLFDISLTGGAALQTLPGLVEGEGSKLLHVWKDARVERGTLKWGTQTCHAAIVRLDTQFHRKPKG